MRASHVGTAGWTRVLCGVLGLASLAASAESIVVYGASGRVGGVIVAEALARGHETIGVSRDPGSMEISAPNFSAVQGDVTSVDSMMEIIPGADAVVIAVRGIGSGNTPEEAVTSRAAETFIQAAEALGEAAPKVIQIGGGTTLRVNGVSGLDNPELEPGTARHGNAFGHWRAIEAYRAADGLRWAVLTPPPGAMTPDERTAAYRLGEEEVLFNEQGESTISMADFAVAVVDEAEGPLSLNRRATVGPPN